MTEEKPEFPTVSGSSYEKIANVIEDFEIKGKSERVEKNRNLSI